jgi:hypothetical protein
MGSGTKSPARELLIEHFKAQKIEHVVFSRATPAVTGHKGYDKVRGSAQQTQAVSLKPFV